MKYELTARRLREAMNDLQISQQTLADRSGIGKSSISHYVNGSNEPGNKSAYEMARVLNVNPAWLMGLDVPKHSMTDEEKLNKANELFTLYENATPEVRAAVETILKSAQRP